jgi:hypothetical protein
MGIGASSNYKHKNLGIKWPSTSIKCLGVYINNDTDKICQENLELVINKCENILNMWNIQKLTLKGKVLICNTLVTPHILYLSSIMHVPSKIIKKLQDMIVEFVWNGKPPKVKYKCMINRIEQGGLKLQDIDSKIKSLKLKWIKAICDTEVEATWKHYLKSFYKEPFEDIMQYNTMHREPNATKSKFYNELFEIWGDLHMALPINSEEMSRQLICNNALIRIGNKPISKEKWPYAKIKYIQDLLDNDRTIANKEYLENKFNIQIDIMTYNGLKTAIAKEWKKEMQKDTNILNYVIFTQYNVIMEGKKKQLIECSTKDLY